jgi:class 3 adenylate cyclase
VAERTKEIENQKIQLQDEKDRSDSLLLNILPRRTADELKKTGSYKAQTYNNVTVMFCDIVDFTTLGEKLNAQELVHDLHEFFSGVDDIIARRGIEKIKTIGDAYLCASGLNEDESNESAIDMIQAAIEIIEFNNNLNILKNKGNRLAFSIRIGIHTGSLTAGVVGKTKYAYDIWGDTVNMASRMQSCSEPGKINISGYTYNLIQDEFNLEYRGQINAKNKGNIDMYFVGQN